MVSATLLTVATVPKKFVAEHVLLTTIFWDVVVPDTASPVSAPSDVTWVNIGYILFILMI